MACTIRNFRLISGGYRILGLLDRLLKFFMNHLHAGLCFGCIVQI